MSLIQAGAQAFGIAAAVAAGLMMLVAIGLTVAMFVTDSDDEGTPALGCAVGAAFWAVVAAICLTIGRF